MKFLLALCLFLAAPLALAGEPSSTLQGEVLEVKNAAGYTYLRLKTKQGETWAAVNRAQAGKGDQVTIQGAMVMEDFESKSLKKTFPKIVFGALAGPGAEAAPARAEMAAAHAGLSKAKEATPDMQVAKAAGPNARTVAEVYANSATLKDKSVQVRGKVTKYNAGILGKNWVHLRDGSGAAADGSNDLLVTTSAPAKVGDVVTASGPVRLNKDFGAGYVYKVLVEDAALQP